MARIKVLDIDMPKLKEGNLKNLEVKHD